MRAGQVNWFKHFNAEKNENALQRYEGQSYNYYGVLENHLKNQKGGFILNGSKPSAVDLHFYAWIKLHAFAGLSLDKFPTIAKWLNTVGEMKEVKAAYEKVPKGQQM